VSLRALLILLTCLIVLPRAASADVEGEVRRFLNLYTQAWSTLNPFELQRLAEPGAPTFRALILSDAMDSLASKTVRLEDIRFVSARQVSFVEVHDNLSRGGTLSSVRLQVQLSLADLGGWLAIRARLVRPMEPAPVARGFARAMEALDEDHPKRAVMILGSVRDQAAEHPVVLAELHYLEGLCRRALGDPAAAIKGFRAALEQNPIFPWAMNALGEQELLAGHPREAERLFRASLAVDPEQRSLQTLRRMLELALGLGDEAAVTNLLTPLATGDMTNLSRVDLAPLTGGHGSIEATELRATILLAGNQLERGLDVLYAAHRRFGDTMTTRYLLGRTLLLLGRYNLAVDELEDVDSETPGCEDAPLLLALALEGTEAPDDAIEVYEDVLEARGGRDGLVDLRLGRLLIRLGYGAEGVSHLESARRHRLNRTQRKVLYELLVDHGYDPLG
jgi:tetratricopeptide (TPR) repeat protein